LLGIDASGSRVNVTGLPLTRDLPIHRTHKAVEFFSGNGVFSQRVFFERPLMKVAGAGSRQQLEITSVFRVLNTRDARRGITVGALLGGFSLRVFHSLADHYPRS
jgi:hypothetical protein